MQHTASPDPSAHHAVFSATALLPRYPRVPDIPATGALRGTRLRSGRSDRKRGTPADLCRSRAVAAGHCRIPRAHRYSTLLRGRVQQGAPIPGDRVIIGIRDLYGRIPDRDLAVAAFAVRTIGSSKTSRFCGRCGHETLPGSFRAGKEMSGLRSGHLSADLTGDHRAYHPG